jgi:hypothetical protein
VYSLGAGPIENTNLASGGTPSKVTIGGSPAASIEIGAGGTYPSGGAAAIAAGATNAATGGKGTGGSNCASGGLGATADIVSVSSDGTIGNQTSDEPALSADGRIVVFASAADNLVPGDTNGVSDVFALDRVTGSMVRVSVDQSGAQFAAPSSMAALSPDATRIALVTSASNIASGANGKLMVIASTGLSAGLTGFIPGLTAVSPLDADADSSYPLLANGGSLIVYRSKAANLVPGDTNDREDFFTVNPTSGVTTRIITANDDPGFVIDSCAPKLSSDGSTLAFCGHFGSAPQNVYAIRLSSGASQLVGVTESGAPSGAACYLPTLSANGNLVAFLCDGADIVSGDTNNVADAFVRNLTSGVTTRASLLDQGTETQFASIGAAINGNGRWVAFQLGKNIPNDASAIYSGVGIFDLECGDSTLFFFGSAIGTVGSTIPLTELSLNDNASTLVGSAGSNSGNANTQIVAVSYDLPP